jgi:RNA polymerase sigma factor (sigma-70 family)
MATGAFISLLSQLRDASFEKFSAASDAELLECFVARRDEVAFEVLLRRHGPMVYAVCLRVLHHKQDAEDAFQATFLILAHKAGTVSPRSKLAGWLHGVAHKTALKALGRANHRSEVEKRVPVRSPEEMHGDSHATEVEAVLDQEIGGLPERYRLPIILCDLEGRLRVEVANMLHCSEGTLSSRLTRGRRMLADRLRRRGVGPTAGGIALVLTSRTNVLAESLILQTVPVALSSLACSAGEGGAASPNVAQLATGVMKSMLIHKLRTAAAGVLGVATVISAALAASYESKAAPASTPAPVVTENAKDASESPTDIEVRLLRNRKILKELRCDIDQFDKIMDTLEEADQKARLKSAEVQAELRANGGNFGLQQRTELRKKAQEEAAKEFKKHAEGPLMSTLNPAQRKRLGQIDLQVRGYEAFQLPTVAKALEITAKQKEDLEKSANDIKGELLKSPNVGRAIGGGAAGSAGAMGGGGAFSPQFLVQIYKATEEARDKGMKQAMAILVDEQKANWKKLTGEPLSLPITSIWALGGYQFAGVSVPQYPLGMVTAEGAVPQLGSSAQPTDPKKEK